jgi:hypothetical protein
MAKALQCPSCGATTRLDAVPDTGAVRCGSCGQSMKVPPGVGGRSSASSGAGGAVPPPRRSRERAPASAPAGSGGGTAVIPKGAEPGPAVARPTASPAASPPVRPSGSGAAAAEAGGRDALPLPLRILAWVVALPLGLAIVGIPARQAGYLSSQKLLDVIVKRDLGRFLPIVVVIALWALVSAVLVTIFVEGGRRLMQRRRRRKAAR